jgi:hypothetical protein
VQEKPKLGLTKWIDVGKMKTKINADKPQQNGQM